MSLDYDPVLIVVKLSCSQNFTAKKFVLQIRLVHIISVLTCCYYSILLNEYIIS